nr:bifunctional riboflavin kinase/FAD synthetase [Parvularcula maris]
MAEPLRGAVAVMGNLDGVHLGHQTLIAEAKKVAEEMGRPLAAVTFEPHPRRVFNPDAPPFLLTPLEVKAELLEEAGCEHIFALPFIPELYKQSPDAFVRGVLAETLGLSGIVTGQDFQFGKDRAGSSETLAKIAGEVGMTYRAIEPVGEGEQKHSSSTARGALREGRPGDAKAVLGRDWFVRGEVVRGRELARTLGFPTANVVLGDVIRPKYGVYACQAVVDGNTHGAVTNIGIRPTVDGKEERLEVHLFDFDGDLYGKTIDCHFIRFIREERKMDGLDALKAQIAKDSEAARAVV